MSNNINQIKAELESLGYETYLSDSPNREVVTFPYIVETGSYEGKKVTMGIGMDGNGAYPECPPHWIHVPPPIDDGKGGAVEKYSDANGREWIAMSRPPGEIWDRLPAKHMHAYLTEHLRRFWNGI